LELDLPIPVPAATPPEVAALAERLRALKGVQEMIVFDIALTDAVKDTVDKIWTA
jgi:hypothetical protein